MRHSVEYETWQNMKRRIIDPRRNKDHGAKGIKICDRWFNFFDNFLEDMGKRPGPRYTIERVDNNGNYEPSNCRWATYTEQNRNKSGSSKNITGIKGVSLRKDTGKYTARISLGKRGESKNINLGCFSSIEEAFKARKVGELRYWS